MTSKSAKSEAGAKARKATQARKSSSKPAHKASAKASPGRRPVKASAKAPAKPAPKKSVAKPLTKPASKPARRASAKPSSKHLAKAPAKSARKPAAKPPSKPFTKKPAAKTAAAVAKRAATTPKSMSLSRAAAKARTPAARAPKSAAVQTAKQATVKPGAQVPGALSKAAPAPIVKPVVAPPAPRPVRTSRLQQLTVPGMAQSIASTAAKSSYSQLPAQVVVAPPVYVAAAKDPKLVNNWKRKSLEDLTDADVLAMPDTEYMNQVQMSYFKRMLVKLRADMLSNAGETTEHLREDTVIVPDPADRATIEEEHALELRTRDRERKLLKKVEQSINRIDSGDYGYCDETGEPIGVGRLLARPTANLSLEAQQRRELKQKMFGD